MHLQNVDFLVREVLEENKRRRVVVEPTRIWEVFFPGLSRDKRANEAQQNKGFAT
jgi:hypothetical protein